MLHAHMLGHVLGGVLHGPDGLLGGGLHGLLLGAISIPRAAPAAMPIPMLRIMCLLSMFDSSFWTRSELIVPRIHEKSIAKRRHIFYN